MYKNLIIGGNGYIGSALYPKINADSVDLCLFGEDLGYSIKENYNNFSIEEYDNIILLAGHSSVHMCEYNKQNAWKNNVDYFYKLCERLNSNQLLIYASSSSVYGKKNNICVESDINLNAINHYDLTKITNDIIANKFINQGKKIIGLRFGTVNGYSKNTRVDLMINSMVYSAINNGYIKISNEIIKRPILAIDDLVNCIICILESKELKLGQYNLCSFNSSVKEISKVVSEVLDCQIIKGEDSKNSYDFQISNHKFENDYGFKFKCDIISIISTMVNSQTIFYSERKNDGLFNNCI
jgi:nucleoside-diphosphate-sugar epimerase